MSRQRYFYRMGRLGEKPQNNLPHRGAELLRAAGRGPVHILAGPFLDGPQILCATDSPPTAALAHKLVGNKIASPGPSGWGFAKFRGERSELF